MNSACLYLDTLIGESNQERDGSNSKPFIIGFEQSLIGFELSSTIIKLEQY